MRSPGVLIIVGLICLAGVLMMVSNCRGDKKVKQVEKAEVKRIKIVNQDSIITAIANASLRREDSIVAVHNKKYEALMARYSAAKKKEAPIAIRYRQAPSLPLCDTLLKSKDSRIELLEVSMLEQNQALVSTSKKVDTLTGLVANKEQTIADLNAGWADANEKLKKALKPKPWSVGVGAGAIMGTDLKPQPGIFIGVQRKLFQF